jgi:hypothetical protein
LVVSVGVLFSHSWTWFILMLSLGGFLLLEWRSARGIGTGLRDVFKSKVILVGTTVAVGLVCDFARSLLSAGSSSASVGATVQSSLGLPNLGFLVSGLWDSVSFYLGGVFANQLLVLLFVVGFFVMLSFRSEVTNFFVSWVCLGCLSMLFASGVFVFNRFLFLMPGVVFCGLGLSFVVRAVGGVFAGFGKRKRWAEFLVVFFAFLILLVYALRYVTNLNLM